MARPEINKEDKRTHRVSFRVNEREKGHLAKLCVATNLPVSEMVRQTVLNNRLPRPKAPVLDQKTYLELKRIGNNVNQIAKNLNAGLPGTDYRPIAELNAKLEEILKKLLG